MKIVSVEDVTKEYSDQVALDGLSVEFETGKFIAIYGPSGSGKTTLLNLIAGFDRPDSGRILYDGVELNEMSEDELREYRKNEMGFVFQSFNLIPFFTVRENVELANEIKGEITGETTDEIDRILERVGLGEKKGRKPNEISAGEKQRVGIARALAKEPEIVLADEPTGNLDSDTGKRVTNLMKEINSEGDVTFVIATHDPEIARIADEVMTIRDGKIHEKTPEFVKSV